MCVQDGMPPTRWHRCFAHSSCCAVAHSSLHSGHNSTLCLRHWHSTSPLYNAGADDIIKQAAQMRTAAQAELVLDENSESEAVISYLSDLVQKAGRQQAEQQRIVQHQTFLSLPRMVNEDLAQAKEEVNPLSLPCTAAMSGTLYHLACMDKRKRIVFFANFCP